MTVKKLLIGALELIQVGWTQSRGFETRDGVPHYCLAGALGAVKDVDIWEYFDGAVKVLENNLPEGKYSSIVQFNDDPNTTKKDVINLLDKTIANLENV
jgi:hypothetical protein